MPERNLDSFRRIVEVSKERVRVGDLAQVELVRTQLAELQFNNAVIQARLRLRIAKQRLQLLMGRATPSELFDVVGEMRREPLPFTLEELWRQALARRPTTRRRCAIRRARSPNCVCRSLRGKSIT